MTREIDIKGRIIWKAYINHLDFSIQILLQKMHSIRILSICAILAVVFYIASADSYTSKKDDDIVRLLKAGCGSSRLLLEAAKASGLTPPYKVKKGQILQLPSKLQHKMETYTNKILIAQLL